MNYMTNQPRVRRLFWDIETSPNVMLSWRAGFKINLGPENIIAERKVICICWKWEGEGKTYELHWDENQDDKEMLKAFVKVAEEADEMIAHYGDGFDMPWFRTRCLIHKLTPLPAYKTIDTKAWAAKYFYFNSNKLDYLGKVLGHGQKMHTEYDLWKKIVLEQDAKSLRYMVAYCQQDVRLLEKVWASMRFCVAPKTHSGVFAGLDKWTCPHCASEDVNKDKTRITAQGHRKHQMRCQNEKCNSYYQITDAAFAQYNEAKRPKARVPQLPPQGGKRIAKVAAR